MTRPASSEAASSSQRARRPARTCRARPASRAAHHVRADQAGQPPDVGQHMDGHRAEPQHEERLVQEQPRPGRGLGYGQHHPGADHAERGAEHHRPEHPEQQGRRAFPPVVGGPGVVPGKPVTDRGRLERHRADQQHAEEEMHRDQLVDGQDGEPLGREQHQKHGPGRGGQPLVAVGTAGPVLRSGRGPPRRGPLRCRPLRNGPRPGWVRPRRRARWPVVLAWTVRAKRAPLAARHQTTSSPRGSPHPACGADSGEPVQEPFRTGKEKPDLSRTRRPAGAALRSARRPGCRTAPRTRRWP